MHDSSRMHDSSLPRYACATHVLVAAEESIDVLGSELHSTGSKLNCPDSADSSSASSAQSLQQVDAVTGLLAELQLEEYQMALVELGATTLQHLCQVIDRDLEDLGMPRLHRRSLLRRLEATDSSVQVNVLCAKSRAGSMLHASLACRTPQVMQLSQTRRRGFTMRRTLKLMDTSKSTRTTFELQAEQRRLPQNLRDKKWP